MMQSLFPHPIAACFAIGYLRLVTQASQTAVLSSTLQSGFNKVLFGINIQFLHGCIILYSKDS